MNIKRLLVFLISGFLVVVGIFLAFSLFQNTSNKSPDVNCTNLFLRANIGTELITIGDTEYLLSYGSFPESLSILWIRAPFISEHIKQPKIGSSYNIFGIEINIEDIGSDNSFIKINVKPLIENYMLFTHNYTRVDIPLNDSKTLNIKGLSTDKTNQYTFKYECPSSSQEVGSKLIVETLEQSKQYSMFAGLEAYGSRADFELEIRLYKADIDHMILYVAPLY